MTNMTPLPHKLRHARVLVTGGAGFIGSHLTAALLAHGCQVTVLDNFSTGKEENIAAFAADKDFRLIRGDIRNLAVCREAVAGAELVLHEAALGSVPRSVRDPATTTAVNILGFVNVLHAAAGVKVRRVVYASSSSVYGDSPARPKTEDETGNPLSPYAVSKAVNELHAKNFHDLYGIDTVGLRYFNVFGPRQDPEGDYAAVIPKFAAALIRHDSPVINGDGSYSRDFTPVDNVVQANLLALATDAPDALNQVCNVACGAETSLNELFELLRAALSAFDPEIAHVMPQHGPVRPGDIPHSLASIAKARALLGYEPRYDLKTGLQAAAEWYFTHLRESRKTAGKKLS